MRMKGKVYFLVNLGRLSSVRFLFTFFFTSFMLDKINDSCYWLLINKFFLSQTKLYSINKFVEFILLLNAF